MGSGRSPAEDYGMSSWKCESGESERVWESSQRDRTASRELACMERLLLADWKGSWGKPLTADELLVIGKAALEPLFHEAPIGPIPEYLTPHMSVYGCVAEYEEKLEELDRWKALELNRWLKGRIGTHWRVAGKCYELRAEKEESATSEKFWFILKKEPNNVEC